MRIVVFSDSHGQSAVLKQIIDKHSGADMFLHLGDGLSEACDMKMLFPEHDIRAVRGNCDRNSPDGLDGFVSCGGWHIFYTHGHSCNVKLGLDALEEYARDVGAHLALFGHTHLPVEEYRDGLYLFNPGSISFPIRGRASYGIVDITRAGLVTNVVYL